MGDLENRRQRDGKRGDKRQQQAERELAPANHGYVIASVPCATGKDRCTMYEVLSTESAARGAFACLTPIMGKRGRLLYGSCSTFTPQPPSGGSNRSRTISICCWSIMRTARRRRRG